MHAELSAITEQLQMLSKRVDVQEAQGIETQARLESLHSDMRQRFRALTDRVSAIETRLAA